MKSKIIFALLFASLAVEAGAQSTEIKTDKQTITITQEKSEAEKRKEAAEKSAPVADDQKTTEIKTQNQTIVITAEQSEAEKNRAASEKSTPVVENQSTTEIKTEKQTIVITQESSESVEKKTIETEAAVSPNGKILTDNGYTRPDAKERRKRYVKSIFSPVALGRSVVGAGVGTWRNSPVEWGDNWEGFGRRVASGLGKNVIKQTTVYALDESFGLDSKFYRSEKRDFNSKLGNALLSPFTARDRSGRRVFGFPRIVGTYASNIIAYETWYPNRFGFKDGLKAGTISLGFNAAFNVLKEFVWKK